MTTDTRVISRVDETADANAPAYSGRHFHYAGSTAENIYVAPVLESWTSHTTSRVEKLWERFLNLADKWHWETAHLSSPSSIALHPAYQRIIGMGEPAIPLILQDLQIRGGPWYWALAAIADESPVTGDISGNIPAIKQAWLEWGKRRGYID